MDRARRRKKAVWRADWLVWPCSCRKPVEAHRSRQPLELRPWVALCWMWTWAVRGQGMTASNSSVTRQTRDRDYVSSLYDPASSIAKKERRVFHCLVKCHQNVRFSLWNSSEKLGYRPPQHLFASSNRILGSVSLLQQNHNIHTTVVVSRRFSHQNCPSNSF